MICNPDLLMCNATGLQAEDREQQCSSGEDVQLVDWWINSRISGKLMLHLAWQL